MARRTFFSFHYHGDVKRVMQIRKSWVTRPDREDAGFFDSSIFESKQRSGDNVLIPFLNAGLDGCSVTCVLSGAGTSVRKWVRYEIVRSFQCGKGLLEIDMCGMKGLDGDVCQGGNTLSCLAFKVNGARLEFFERTTGGWTPYRLIESMPLKDVVYDLKGMNWHAFGALFSRYQWIGDNGYENIGGWIEKAAAQAGK